MKINTKKVTVRPIANDDLDAILEIDRGLAGRDRSAYMKGKFLRATNEEGHLSTSLVADYEGKAVGFIMGEVYLGEFGIPDDTATIDTIGVHPDYQRNGIAHLLLDEFKSRARSAGIRRLHTLVEWHERELIHFFGTVGFRPARTLSLETELD